MSTLRTNQEISFKDAKPRWHPKCMVELQIDDAEFVDARSRGIPTVPNNRGGFPIWVVGARDYLRVQVKLKENVIPGNQ
jgi:hypothetical protein